MKPALLLISAFVLTACGSSQKFSESDLNPALYKGYWAMLPVNDIHRVVKFLPNGSVKIYDYRCDGDSYRLEETLTHYLSTRTTNKFTLLDEKKKAFAHFDILRTSAQQLQARQQFLDASIEPRNFTLNYTNMVGAKPICATYLGY